MLVSKLNIKMYPFVNPARWVKYRYPKQSGIDPVFEIRLAALGRALGLVIEVIRGAVNIEEQKAIAEVLLRQNRTWIRGANGAVYNARGQCMVAAPGTSPHEQHLAIDGDKRIEALSDSTLVQFGLFRPMPYERWHIQPVETRGMAFLARQKLEPIFIDGTVAENQKLLGLTPDDIYGPKTHEVFAKRFL